MNERKRRDVVPLASTVYVTGVEPGNSRATVALAAVGFGATYTEAIELIAAGRVNDLVDAFPIVDEQADAAVVIGMTSAVTAGTPVTAAAWPTSWRQRPPRHRNARYRPARHRRARS